MLKIGTDADWRARRSLASKISGGGVQSMMEEREKKKAAEGAKSYYE
jgi:hypothetical protein